MNLEIVYNLFSNLNRDTLSFFYQGAFSDEITDKIIDLSEHNIANRQDQAKMSSKVSFLMAECFQNIVRHGESVKQHVDGLRRNGIFITRHIGSSYYITSANLIEISEIPNLERKLEQINQLGKEELKALYMDILANEGLSAKGGAGLGLVEMARKSGQKLEFHFEPFDDHFSYFYLQIKMKSNFAGEEIVMNEEIPITDAKAFHKQMTENNVLVIHRGDYSQESVIPILRMLENNLHTQFDLFKHKKKAFHMMVEILQNVSKHSFPHNGVHEGIFVLGMRGDEYVINTGNYISRSEVEYLRSHLYTLNNMTREEQVELYKYTLKEGKGTKRGGAGLGLIDIARESTSKLEYRFEPVDDEKMFYLVSASVR
jgi:hypothetical protein